MATYTIVASTTDPLGPGEVAAGSPILVSEGDVFIIDASADAKITFQAAGGIPASFDVVINDSNVNTFEITVLSDLTPTITVADNVGASGIKLGAAASDAVNFTAGDNVQFGEYIGSIAGADTISIGNGFTTTKNWSTSGGDDSIIVGDNATFVDIDVGSGNDTISLGDGVTTGKIQGGVGDDSITIGKDATVSSVDGEGGNDTLTTGTGGLTVSNVETTNVVCYAKSTLIDTPDGPRAVEDLQVGDLVVTVDHGAQAIRWVRSSDHRLEEAAVDDKPVLIAAGALGNGISAQNLIVSPQHRILVGGHRQLQDLFESEAFVSAKSLTSLDGIRHMKGKIKITWIHFACDRHEVVTANGCLSESLLLGPMVVNGLTGPERQAVVDIFGPALTPEAALNGPLARECLKVGTARKQLVKSRKEQGHRVKKGNREMGRRRSDGAVRG